MENSPSALLQAELTSLSAEKIDLQRKLDQTSGSSKVTRQKLLKAYQVQIYLYLFNIIIIYAIK